MSELTDLLREISGIFDEKSFPPGFLDAYDPMECLASGHGTETFLVREKNTQTLYVAKCYDRTQYNAVKENALLQSVRNIALPRWKATFEDERCLCVVREYMEGTSLDQFAKNMHFSAHQAVAMCVQLCDVLVCLHEQTPPIIHRDIKPSNIIVKPDGQIALIDFDIAREYHPDAKADTQCFATREYAPPEQYGFTQTDGRADIYATGVLLCWLLSGETDVRKARIADRRLSSIIRRCTAWAPEHRYPSARTLRKALLYTISPVRSAIGRWLPILTMVALALCVGFAAGRYTNLFSFAGPSATIVFQEPLIEKAVRLQLGKESDETLTQEELNTVQGIYVFGNAVGRSAEDFRDGLTQERKNWPRGEIRTLEDLRMLPNLTEISVCYQDLSDIAPVTALQNLISVDFRHTRIADASPLGNMASLCNVNLFDTNVSEVRMLDTCPRLNRLDIGKTLVHAVGDIGGKQTLTVLSLKGLQLDSMDGIEACVHLTQLYLQDTSVLDLTPLLAAPSLRSLVVNASLSKATMGIEPKAGFSVTYE